MIDKFNFYDIYGYLLPGAALLLLLWLPLVLCGHASLGGDWTSALLGAVLAYLSGVLLQMIATRVIPSWVKKGSDGHDRYPSDVVLDSDDSHLAVEFKKKLAAIVLKSFDLDVGWDKPASKAIDLVRRNAFFLARHALIRTKEVSYAEQFQGMYTLTRGLATAFCVATVYYTGFTLSVFRGKSSLFVAGLLVTSGLLVAITTAAQLLRTPRSPVLEQLCALGLMIAFVAFGYGLGCRYGITQGVAGPFGLAAGVALLGFFRSYAAYKNFSNDFALTVWRDFYASTIKDPPPADTLAT